MTLEIVPTRAVAFDAWLELWLAYVDGQIAPDAPLHAATYERLCAQASLHGIVAIGQGQPCGFAHYYFHPSTWALTPPCYVQDLYVSPAARGRRLGMLLLDEVQTHAAQRGSPVVHWNTRADNLPARALYDRIATASDRVIYLRPVPAGT